MMTAQKEDTGFISANRIRWLRKRIFGIPLEETTFARRGFPKTSPEQQQRLEQIGRTFVHGYHAALDDDDPDALGRRLLAVEAERRGFAFEGAAMGLALLDRLPPWKRDRWLAFVRGPGAAHIYMMHVGIGWALARLHRRVDPARMPLDPLLRWLVVDGYGFHEGYFHWRRSVRGQAIPAHLTGYARRVFDHGLGRSLWFVAGAEVLRSAEFIAQFPPGRQADLWSGIGLACAYAGGAERTALEALRAAADPFQPRLAQGAAFAAQARQRAGNPAPHTELACTMLCGRSAAAAAAVTEETLKDLPLEDPLVYEIWRQRIQDQFRSVRR